MTVNYISNYKEIKKTTLYLDQSIKNFMINKEKEEDFDELLISFKSTINENL